MPHVKYRLNDKKLVERLLFALRKGATYALACNYAGMSPTTFSVWMRRGEKQLNNEEEDCDEHLKLYLKVKEAEGEAVLIWLDLIETAASNGNWQAAAWKLERRYPNEYGRFTPEQPKNPEPIDNTSDEARIVRIIALSDEARARAASKRPRSPVSKGNDSK
jgi:hypothetical protein